MQKNIRPFAPTEEKDYKVGLSVAGLLRIRDLGISFPDQVIYQPYAESYTRSDDSKVGDGKAVITWTWDVMSLQEASTLFDIFFTSETDTYADDIYIRSDKRLAHKADPRQMFANFKATVIKPEVFGPDGTPISRSSYGIQTVRWTFTNLVEQ